MRRLLLALFLLCCCAAVVPAQAQVTAPPNLMNFSGRLTRPDGTPVADGTYSVRFSLWSALTGGTEKWNQTLSVVAKNGTFAALLSNFPANAFDGNLFLEIKIGSDVALTPRQQLVSVPYAQKANTVPDGSITQEKLAAGVGGIPGGAAGGDLTGTYPNPDLATKGSSLYKVSGTLMSALSTTNSVDVQQTQTPLRLPDTAWQSFTAGQTGNLTALDLSIGTTTGANKTMTIILYQGEGIGGTVLGSASVTFVPTFGLQRVNFPVPIAVTAGQKYTWGTAALSSSLEFGYATGNPYSGGRAGAGATFDMGFQTYISTAGSQVSVNASLLVSNKIGIATTPNFPLSFANLLGDKISLWGQSGNHYGFGIDSNLLQIHSATASTDIAFGYGSSASFTERMRIKGNGRVGIGTNNPQGALHIASTGTALLLRPNAMGLNDFSEIRFADPDNGTGPVALKYYDDGKARLQLEGGNLVTTTGSIGIGTNSPTSPLSFRNADERKITFWEDAVLGYYGVEVFGGIRHWSGLLGSHTFGHQAENGSFVMDVIIGHGVVGIGTPAPQNLLHVNSASGGQDAGLYNGVHIGPDLGGQSRIELVENAGTPYIDFLNDNFGNFDARLILTGNDTIELQGATLTQSSDRRWKQNIHTLDNALDAILNLRGVSFEWNAEAREKKGWGEKEQIGFIAQEVEKILPELVSTDKDGYKSVAYQNIAPVLVEAIKQQQKQMTDLKNENQALRTRNETLEARLNAIEAALAELRAQKR